MNRDATGITSATDAAAPAVAPDVTPAATPLTPAEPFAAMDEPGSLTDHLEIREHFETDAELAELAVARLNRGMGVELDGGIEVDEFHHRDVAEVSALILASRALMRSAAANERLCAIHERSETRLLANHARDEEYRRLQLENLRLQNAAFTGEVQRLTEISGHAIALVNVLRAGASEKGPFPTEALAEFFRGVSALATPAEQGAAS